MDSPIPIFPRPLALSYVNFETHYSSYEHDGTRLAVANTLISALLLHYFPNEIFDRRKLDQNAYIASPIVSLPEDPCGVTYWAVTTRTGNAQTNIDTPELIGPSRPLLVIIATDPGFIHLEDRINPGKLHFAPSAIGADGAFCIGENSWRSGIVILLTAKSRPVSPQFEVYTFDVDGEDAQCLVPFRYIQPPEKNTVSCSRNDVDLVNNLFDAFSR